MHKYFSMLLLMFIACTSRSLNAYNEPFLNISSVYIPPLDSHRNIVYLTNKMSDMQTRIIGGFKLSVLRAPYQVSLQWYNFHFCGGALYSLNMVVSAAHCLDKRDPEEIFVRAGSSVPGFGGQVFGVVGIAIHEQYSRNLSTHDIAVLRLDVCVQQTNRIHTIQLAKNEPRNNAPVLVSGFGRTKSGKDAEHLMGVYVRIVPRKACAKIFGKEYITATNICAASRGRDACQGDSGGPLVYRQRLVGVVSWGKGCANRMYPGVYANVAALYTWIMNATDELNKL